MQTRCKEVAWVFASRTGNRMVAQILVFQFRRNLCLAVLLVFGALAVACARPTDVPTSRKHVLLLTVDTLRADHLSIAGYDRPTTPFLDSIIEEGMLFENALSTIPRTTPAVASLMTGRYPHGHEVRSLFEQLPKSVPYLPVLARDRGYRTIAVVANHILVKKRGLDRGFDIYDQDGDVRDAVATTERVLAHAADYGPEDNLFIWAHYIDPHVPYYPPPEFARSFDPGYEGRYLEHFGAVRGGQGDLAYPEDLPKVEAVYHNTLSSEVNAHIRRLYAADVRAADDAIRDLVTGLRNRFGNNWTIVFTSDHGESLGEHDFYYDHGDYVYNPSLHVPLAIILPKGDELRRSGRVKQWVSLVDVAPTLIELLGLETNIGIEGQSLVPLLAGKPLEPRPVFAESGKSFFAEHVRRRVAFDIRGRFRVVIAGNWKLIWTPGQTIDQEYELFNLQDDPGETKNLYSADHPKATLLRSTLSEWMRETRLEASEPDADDIERLRALGYVQ